MNLFALTAIGLLVAGIIAVDLIVAAWKAGIAVAPVRARRAGADTHGDGEMRMLMA